MFMRLGMTRRLAWEGIRHKRRGLAWPKGGAGNGKGLGLCMGCRLVKNMSRELEVLGKGWTGPEQGLGEGLRGAGHGRGEPYWPRLCQAWLTHLHRLADRFVQGFEGLSLLLRGLLGACCGSRARHGWWRRSSSGSRGSSSRRVLRVGVGARARGRHHSLAPTPTLTTLDTHTGHYTGRGTLRLLIFDTKHKRASPVVCVPCITSLTSPLLPYSLTNGSCNAKRRTSNLNTKS